LRVLDIILRQNLISYEIISTDLESSPLQNRHRVEPEAPPHRHRSRGVVRGEVSLHVTYRQFEYSLVLHSNLKQTRGRHDHDRMVVGFTTTCAISANHH
jgi:hypothetical protein